MKAVQYYYCMPEKVFGVLPDLARVASDIPGFSMSRLKYLLSTITTHKQDNHKGAYSVLNMKYLRNIVPSANEYLQFLKDKGIVEWKNYSAGRNSRLYRIKKEYDGKTIYRTITDRYLIRRIEQNINKIRLRNSKKYPMLNSYVFKVRIDVPAAMETIEKIYRENLISKNIKKREKAEARRTFSIGEVLKIQSRQIYIKVNSTNGRYDSNYTRLPSELVKHLSINSKSLIELDIKNSQPFFAVSLFDPSPEIQNIIGKFFTMYTKGLQLSEREDVMLYTFLVVNGKFYDYMRKQFWLNDIPFSGRDNLKELLFTVFFSRNNSKNYSPAVRLFAKIFPNIYQIFSAIKRNKHNKLSILLQRIESYTMLDCVSLRIIDEFPELEFITKHDSILPASILVSGEPDKIMELMGNEIEKTMKFKPKIKKKADPHINSPNINISDTISPLCVRKPCNGLIINKGKKVG